MDPTPESDPKPSLVARKGTYIEAPPERVGAIQTDVDGWKDWQTDIGRSHVDGALEVNAVRPGHV